MNFRRRLAVLASIIAALWLIPRLLCGVGPDRAALARSLATKMAAHEGGLFYASGNLRFDGQSTIAIDQMAILGMGQLIVDDASLAPELLPAMRKAADRLASPQTLRYAATRYGAHGITRMGGGGHAYLGYINLALGMLRRVDPETKHAALNDRLSQRLARRLVAAKTGLIETYPGETWPPDVAAVAGSIGLHATVTGQDYDKTLSLWAERFAGCAIHDSGYLYQRMTSGNCKPADVPRGSGTAIAAYFISFVDRDLSARLYRAIADRGANELAGFAAVDEFPPGHSGGLDVNAGPVILGMSVGATGFAIGAAAAHGDEGLFRKLYRSANLLGAGGRRSFAVGGILGNALLLAMLTARPQT